MHETVSGSDSLRQVGSSHGRFVYTVAVFLCTLALGQATPRATGQQVIPRPQAEVIAREKGWPIRKETALGDVIELQKIVNGIPFYYTTYNRTAADSISTDECWPGGSTGLSLTGAGVTLGIWDGGRVRTTHQEFGGRAVQRDGLPALSTHATHVAGTMIGAGLSLEVPGRPAGQSKGMSFDASLDCYDFNSDTNEMAVAAAAGLLASNHSYGLITGWRFDNLGAGQGWYWLGDVNISTFEDYYFGFYSLETASWDTIAYKKPYYLIVKSAGNERNEGPAPGTTHFVNINGNWVSSNTVRSLDGNDGYDSISHSGLSKNILSVGAVWDVIGGYAGPGSVVMSSFSSWGPADDGRIKPDVVGNGIDLYSASSSSNTAYIALSGTSMSSPNVTGSLGLLIQHYRATHGGANMRAATLKGLVVHTADECGSATGPDYSFGWGLVNTAAAANVITLNQTVPGTMQELALVDGDSIEQTWTYSGSGPIRATICWTDPPGTPPPPSLDPSYPALVNDVDLRLVGPDGTTYYPWKLDVRNPAAPAAAADNRVDNVELVDVAAPPSGDYVIRVTHKGTLTNSPQRLALIVTGLTAGPQILGACCVGESCTGNMSESDCATALGEWYGGANCGTLVCPALGACCQGCPPSTTCTSATLVRCDQVDGRWTQGGTCDQVSCALVGDDCASEMQPIAEGVHAFDNRCATTDGPTPVICENGSQPFGRDLWYEYVATCSGTLTIRLCDGTNFDAILALYSDGSANCPCPTDSSLQLGLGADDTCGVGGGPPQLTQDVSFGRCYTIRVAGWDSAAGTGTMEVTCEGIPCPVPDAPVTEPAPVAKDRYLSFVPGNTGEQVAIRVRLASLHHPDPPYTDGSAADFSEFEGQVRWVGPPSQFVESASEGTPFYSAQLQCDPLYHDWSTIGLLHVTGSAIVPSSAYEVQLIAEGCDTLVEPNYSAPLQLSTTRWGDVVDPFNPPDGSAQPDFGDIGALVDKFKSLLGAPIKARALLAGDANGVIDPAPDVGFTHISACVNAFKGLSYPYIIATCP